MAFFAGMIGSVLKAAISLAGALMGPLFGTYLLGIICPFSTEIVCTKNAYIFILKLLIIFHFNRVF